MQLSGSLARGAKLIDQCLHQEPTPQQMAAFERELSALLREVGRRIVAWVIDHMESDDPDEMPSRLWFKGQAYRRRRKHRTSLATLFGSVVVWRRLYEPLMPGRRPSIPWSVPWVLKGVWPRLRWLNVWEAGLRSIPSARCWR